MSRRRAPEDLLEELERTPRAFLIGVDAAAAHAAGGSSPRRGARAVRVSPRRSQATPRRNTVRKRARARRYVRPDRAGARRRRLKRSIACSSSPSRSSCSATSSRRAEAHRCGAGRVRRKRLELAPRPWTAAAFADERVLGVGAGGNVGHDREHATVRVRGFLVADRSRRRCRGADADAVGVLRSYGRGCEQRRRQSERRGASRARCRLAALDSLPAVSSRSPRRRRTARRSGLHRLVPRLARRAAGLIEREASTARQRCSLRWRSVARSRGAARASRRRSVRPRRSAIASVSM